MQSPHTPLTAFFPFAFVFCAILKKELICQWCDVCIFVALYLGISVSLYVRMFVARANKVEGTIS